MPKKCGNFTDEELDRFKELSQECYQVWIEIYGERGATNYIHMLHVVSYMSACKSVEI